MDDLFAELKRRNIYRVAAAYAVVAWIILQLVNNVAPVLDLPVWVARAFLLLLVTGFPMALLFAWMRDLPPLDSAAKTKPGTTDWIFAGVAIGMIAILAYQQFVPSQATRQASVEAARVAAVKVAGISVAVLPFVNLSDDRQQDFFSDGMTEEITAALAKVPDLRVVARTSAFEFKGKNLNIKTMGEQLGATHLIEGSVRKAGEKVRITAQLIKADDGTHLWSENYDRELTDIFAIQEDIARALAASLRMPLGLKPGENLVNNRGIDPESYQQFLRAKALFRGRINAGQGVGGGGFANLKNAIALVEQVVAKNPDYAPAWALLSAAHTVLPNLAGALTMTAAQLGPVVQSSREAAEPAARKAIQLDPNLADGYVALGNVQSRAGKHLLAEEFYVKALALDPNHPDALNFYSQMFSYLGYADKALVIRQQSLALDPFDPNSNLDLARILWLRGEDDAAIAKLKTLTPIQTALIARVHAGAGRFDQAADTLLSAPSGPPDVVKEAVRLLRMAPAAAVPEKPMALAALDFVYLYTDAPERVLEYYERMSEAGWMTSAQTQWLGHPSYAPVRKLERFKSVVRKIGLVEYWRAKGWPKFCHPTTGDDFACN